MTYARAYWDSREGSGRRVSGGWKTTVLRGGISVTATHRTQREAHQAIGAKGGSMDPEYRGKPGDCIVVES